jgi:hypothetical protein
VSIDASWHNGGQAGGLAVQPSTGHVFVYDNGGTIHVYDPTGMPQYTLAWPAGTGNDTDIDFIKEATTIGGVSVPTGSLLVGAGDQDQVYVIDPSSGAVLVGPLTIPATNGTRDVDGIAYDTIRHSIWVVHYLADIVDELALDDLHILQSFPVAPSGSPPFDVFFGDLDVSAVNGDLYLNSDRQSTIRQLTPTGVFVEDIDVTGLLSGMAGLDLDDANAGLAWVSSTDGTVSHVVGLPVRQHNPPFGGDDRGFLPPPKSLLMKCENRVAKGIGKVVKSFAKCAAIRATGKTDESAKDACQAAAVSALTSKTKLDGCGECTDLATGASTMEADANTTNAGVYCAPGTPFGGDDAANVPADAPKGPVTKCEKKVGGAVAKLAGGIITCHLARASGKGDGASEEACEAAAREKFTLTATTGCDRCTDLPTLATTIESQLDGANRLVYCQ